MVGVHGSLELERVNRELHRRAVRALKREGPGVAGQAVIVRREAALPCGYPFHPVGAVTPDAREPLVLEDHARVLGAGAQTLGRMTPEAGARGGEAILIQTRNGTFIGMRVEIHARMAGLALEASMGRTGETGGRHRQGKLLALRRGEGKPGIIVAVKTHLPRRSGGGGSRRAGTHRHGGEQHQRENPLQEGQPPPLPQPIHRRHDHWLLVCESCRHCLPNARRIP